MARSEQELQDLRARAASALNSGSHLARAEEHVVDLVDELLAQRKVGAGFTVKGELLVQKAPEPVAAPEPSVVESLEEGEDSPVSEDYSLDKVLEKVEESAKPKKKR